MGVTETFGILLDWDPQVVSLLVEQSNLNLDGRPEAPQWFQLDQTGKTSTNMLITSIVDHMVEKMGSSTSNKSFGRVLIARHTWSQFGLVIGALRSIENDPYMQFIMKAAVRNAASANCYDDESMFLARLGFISDRTSPGHATSSKMELSQPDDIPLFD